MSENELRYKIKNVTVDHEQQRMEVTWADGHLSHYPLEGLRKSCPCVFCMGGHENMGKKVDPVVFLTDGDKPRKIKNVQVSGNYALQIFWGDGHNTGIYRFDKLRDMCPVEAGLVETS